MVAAQANPTFECAIVPIGMDDNDLNAFYNFITLLQGVSPNKDVRGACSAASNVIDKHKADMYMREEIYRVVKAVLDNKEEMGKLADEDKRLVEKLERKFYTHGLGLDKDRRDRLELQIEFIRNINENILDGLPDDYFDGRETEYEDGILKYVVTSKYPDYSPLIALAKHSKARERMNIAYSNRCPENIPLFQEAIRLRLERARILGKNTHAENVLEDLMAKTPKAVLDMLNNLKDKIGQAWVESLKELSEIKKENIEAADKQDNEHFNLDITYYENIRKVHKYNVDDEEIKQYFPVEHVVPAILKIYQTMLSLRIVKVDSSSVWHPDVELYEVWEAHEDKFIGHFYLDLFPREGKHSHTAMFPTRPGFTKADGSREYPIASMVANFPKPTPSNPALFKHENVKSFMHEMGHVFHELCAVTKWSKFHGTEVERDFIEAPSQMLENWCWQPSVLRQISSHYKTGKPLPNNLIEDMIYSKVDKVLLNDLNLVFYGLYDMAIHNTTTSDIDANKAYNRVYNEVFSSNYRDAGIGPVATLMHLMGGYDATMYSYLWSQVYSADMFATRFLKEGIDNVQTGMDYRREILQPGGSRDSIVSLECFLGRKPNSDAFFRQRGISS
ncbi:hypothetical protein BX070DRAFT_239926 [Coemansia spiralis]|nr:hypothetical protein BX070DRAFT_239926 [Coemansia spiralis]